MTVKMQLEGAGRGHQIIKTEGKSLSRSVCVCASAFEEDRFGQPRPPQCSQVPISPPQKPKRQPSSMSVASAPSSLRRGGPPPRHSPPLPHLLSSLTSSCSFCIVLLVICGSFFCCLVPGCSLSFIQNRQKSQP